MSDEGEREVGREETVRSVTDAEIERSDDEETVDSAAESFLDLETQLKGSGPATIRGRAVGVERVSVEDVPEEYPVEMTTPEALALRLVVDEETEREAVVYFEWSDGTADDRLGRLLALHDIPVDRFADLHGESIRLRIEDGYYVPLVPEERIRGSPRGVYGVAGGLAVNLLTLLLAVGGLGNVLSSVGFVLVLLAVNFVVLPVGTYLDGWYLRTRTDWGQWPAFWATLAAIPGVNVVSSVLYLWYRQRASPLA